MDSETRKNIIKLADRFVENLDLYESDEYNETELRNDFLNPFFKLLGWDVYNEKGLPDHIREVKHEKIVRGDVNCTFPDYLFRTGSVERFYLEAKKPSVNIKSNPDAIYQIRSYGWNGSHPISILSNFKYTIIYDAKVKPNKNDEPHVARLDVYDLKEIEEWIDRFYDLFSFESVLNGSLEQYYSNSLNERNKESFDEYFLKQIRRWRDEIAADVVRNNPSVRNDVLNLYIQKILNRILFLRSCEDRQFEKEETLKNITGYNQLKNLFKESDDKYDSGLFELIKDEFPIGSDAIIHCFKDLYYPESPYDFNIIDTFIIGQIYELFLVERLCNDNGVVSVVQTTVQSDSRGVVKTPRMIVDAITSQLLSSRAPTNANEPVNIRVLDICCGSGIFLLGAFNALCSARLDALMKYDINSATSKGQIIRNGPDEYVLSYGEKRQILENCLYGVDIDDLAVEVTKFSLQLELLKNITNADAESYCKRHKIKILPNLDSHIIVGNSLIDSNYRLFNPEINTDLNLMTSIKMLDWSKKFNHKFDVILGNPPYVRIQKIKRNLKEEYKYYNDKIAGYKTAKSTYDLYFLFIERALNLISEDGEIGFIVSNRFMTIKSGKPLRKLLTQDGWIHKIIDFDTTPIFEGRSNYTSIIFLKRGSESVEYSKVNSIQSFIQGSLESTEVHISNLGSDQWFFSGDNPYLYFEKYGNRLSRLDQVCTISVGLQTSADRIYIISPISDDGLISRFIYNGKEYCIEDAILRPVIYDASLQKYHKIHPNKKIIYPYLDDGAKYPLYSENELKTRFPLAWDYLNDVKDVLCKRSINGSNPTWYQYGRRQGFKLFNEGKILLWPVESLESNYVMDDAHIMFTGGGNGPYYGLSLKKNTNESIYYIQAILNHPKIESIVCSCSPKIRGNYYSHGKEYVRGLPIYRINFNDPNECYIHDTIVSNVEHMMQLSATLETEQVASIRDQIEQSIEAITKANEELLNVLYLDIGGHSIEEEE